MKPTSLRTHCCNELRAAHIGQRVSLAGWVHSRRDHGGVYFLDLRDRSGLVQVMVNPEEAEAFLAAAKLGSEHVIAVSGEVRSRPDGMKNPKLPTGDVEVKADAIKVLNASKALPFEVSEHANVLEETRLKYRFLDLRRPRMLDNLICRHRVAQTVRRALDAEGFLEIETPILTKATPEGARDFIVPSRLAPGNFYALPQSPQIFKQILMVSGVDRYFQLARAFRDEDLRADRQLEHTQIDLEMSFVEEGDIQVLVERMLQGVWREVMGQELPAPFPRLDYDQAMRGYGSDKPDLRYGLALADVSEVFRESKFKIFGETVRSGGRIAALTVPGAAISRSRIDKLTEMIKTQGAKGLPWIVDPKPAHRELYKGATLMTPNIKEISELTGRGVRSDMEVTIAGQALMADLGLKGLLVTRSEKGMALFATDAGHRAPWLIPTEAREVFDVSGAGDTVIAVFSAAVSAGADWQDAAMLANAAAGVVVGKMGTATATPAEVLRHYQDQEAL